MSGDHRPGIDAVARTLLVALLLGLIVSGCSAAATPPDPSAMVNRGSWYAREPWPHDGHPYETEHFVVYSDGASQEARRRLGAMAEEVWVDLIDEMGIDPASMFRYPPGQDKVDIYASRYHVMENIGARAYYAGVIINSFDNAVAPAGTSTGAVHLALKHEMVHVFEALLKGRFVGDLAADDPRRMPVWFSEGIAEYLSGGSAGGAPRTLAQIDELITRYGTIDPISWKVDLPFTDEVADAYSHYYYPMAHLAIQYLLDPRGQDRSPADLTAVMLDMGNDVAFADAFAAHMGITQDAYEAEFFSLMDGYLPPSEFPWEAIGLGLAALAAALLLGGSVVWGLRHEGTSLPASSAAGPRRAFVVEVVALALLAVLLATRGLFSLGFDTLPPATNFALGYAVVAGYVVVCAGILGWSARRTVGPARFLVPLLAVVATVGAVAALEAIV